MTEEERASESERSHLTLSPDDLMRWTMSLWRNPSTEVSLMLAMVSPVNEAVRSVTTSPEENFPKCNVSDFLTAASYLCLFSCIHYRDNSPS